MDGTNYQFEKGTRVALKDIADPSFYDGMAVYGNEGWIVKRRRDRNGLPEVYIHWDTNHWTWNGAQDRWTYEDHFIKVEEPMTDEPTKADLIREAAASFAETVAGLIEEPKPKAEAPVSQDDAEDPLGPRVRSRGKTRKRAFSQDEIDAKRAHAISKIAEELTECDSFLVVAAKREPDESAPRGILTPLVMGFFNYQQDADILVAAQAAAFAARAHQDAAIRMITELSHDGAAG